MKELLKKKKNLIVVLFISFSILLFTTNYVKATEDTNEENTLPDEVNGKIVLNADVNLAETFNIEEGKELTIDLNGHNLIGNIECIIENKGNLTIKDSARTKGKIDLKNGGAILKNSSGNLTIDGITISAVGRIIKNQADSTLMVKNSKLESTGNDQGTEILANWGNATVQNSIIKSTGNIKAIGSHSEIIEEEEKNSELNLINTQIEAGTLFNARRKEDQGSKDNTTKQTIIINGGSIVQKSVNTFSINSGTIFSYSGEINVNDNYLKELIKNKFKYVSGSGAKISVIRGVNTLELDANTEIKSNIELIIPEGTKVNGDITNHGILRLNDEFDGTVTNYGELIQNYEDEKIKIKTSEEGKENITISQLMQLQAVDGESGTYSLKYKPADYTEVDRAIANAMNTIENYEAIISDGIEELNSAIGAVDDDKDIRDQDEVDAMAEAIKQAIDNLVYYDADYTNVNNTTAGNSAGTTTTTGQSNLVSNTISKIQNIAKSGNATGVVTNNNKVTINNNKTIPTKISVKKPSISGTYIYDGTKQTVKLNNFDSNTMRITNNIRMESGKQNVIIELKDKQNYQWEDKTTNNLTLNWTILEKNISKLTASDISNKIYSGKQIKPSVVVKDGKTTLKNGTDYSIAYKNNVNTGKAIITITGKGNYTGTITKSFIITATKVKDIKVKSQKEKEITLSWKKNNGKVTGYKIFVYNEKKKAYDYVGKTSKTTYTIKKLKAGTKYIFKIRAYTVVDNKQYNGNASQILKTATKTKPTKIKAITTKNNNVTLKWNIISKATGYNVYMSTKKNGKYTKISRINNSKIFKYTTDSNLKAGKTYYFKIRTYKKVNGQKIYSAYSKKAKIKVK